MPVSILYVDDEPDLELLITAKYQRAIRADERVCEFARNGVEALAKIDAREQAYDVLVVDISMPEMSGLQLLEELERRELELPVIIVSAYGDIGNIRAAMNRGAFDFLTKPVDLADLEVTQKKALRQAATLRQARAVERAYGRPELAALGLLVAGVAHDLKNPLGFVSTFTALSRELLDELGEEIRERCEAELAADIEAELATVEQTLSKVAAHAKWSLELVSSLLSSAGGDRERCELNALVTSHTDLFVSSTRAHTPDSGLVIDKQLDDSIAGVALAPTRVVSVVINLLENAYHAVRHQRRGDPDATPRISVATRAVDDGVELSVSDNGPGIPARIREQVFEPFFTTKGEEGTGLGLHLVAKIARDAGGRVSIEDCQPSGARVRVWFPR